MQSNRRLIWSVFAGNWRQSCSTSKTTGSKTSARTHYKLMGYAKGCKPGDSRKRGGRSMEGSVDKSKVLTFADCEINGKHASIQLNDAQISLLQQLVGGEWGTNVRQITFSAWGLHMAQPSTEGVAACSN